MKRFSILIVAFVAFALGCVVGPRLRSIPIQAQTVTAKSDLISKIRQDATSLINARNSFKAHKASYDALGFSFVDGDFTGSNAGLTASQFTTGVANLDAIWAAYDAGGTLSVGLPTGVNRLGF